MNKQFDLSLYLVLDPNLCGGIEGMVQTTQIAVKHGVTMVQLRAEYEFSRKQWYLAAKALKEILAKTDVPLIINDQIDIALAVDADGVHVGQNDLPADVVRRLIGRDKLLGLSVSNQSELSTVSWQDVDYLGIGPVFPTTSKKNAAPALGTQALAKLIKQKHRPVVAIGGIGMCNAREVLTANADGIAVVSAICGQKNIAVATKNLASMVNAKRTKGVL